METGGGRRGDFGTYYVSHSRPVNGEFGACAPLSASTSPPTPPYAASPFDRHAAEYAARWGQDPTAQRMRASVYACAEVVFPPGGRVLDAGCGAGLDSAWLLARGHRVTSIDQSARMIAETRRRAPGATVVQMSVEDAGSLVYRGQFDGALMNFGVLNCVDLPATARALAEVLVPGAPLLLVPMPRVSPAWMLSRLAQGHPREALRRLRPALDIDVEGAAVYTRYLSISDIQRDFDRYFKLERFEALGLTLPPPGAPCPPRLRRALERLDERTRTLPLLRGWGDHLLVVLRRTEAPAR